MSASAQTVDKSAMTNNGSPAVIFWPGRTMRSMIHPLAGADSVTIFSAIPVFSNRSICSSTISQSDKRRRAEATRFDEPDRMAVRYSFCNVNRSGLYTVTSGSPCFTNCPVVAANSLSTHPSSFTVTRYSRVSSATIFAEVRTARDNGRFSTGLVASPIRCRASLEMETGARPAGVFPVDPSTSNATMSIPIESLPGLSLTSLGFIVDRYIVFFGVALVSGALAVAPSFIGTSFMLQIGQLPGLSDTTEGCIGQWYLAVVVVVATSFLPQETNATLI